MSDKPSVTGKYSVADAKPWIIPAKYFLSTVAGNVDNPNLTDADFRDMIRNTLPIVDYHGKPKEKDSD